MPSWGPAAKYKTFLTNAELLMSLCRTSIWRVHCTYRTFLNNAEALMLLFLLADHQKTTQSTNKTPTPIWRNRIQASSPCKTSQESTKKAQPQNSSNSTSQVQAQKIKTQSTSTPLISSPQKEQKEKTKNQPSISSLVQRTFRVISSAKPSSSTVKKAPCQKDSSPQKVWKEKILKQQALESSTAVQRRTLQVNSSSKRPPTVTNKNPHFQKDSSSSSQKETKKQTSTRGPEKAKESASATPVYYIRWDGRQILAMLLHHMITCCLCDAIY